MNCKLRLMVLTALFFSCNPHVLQARSTQVEVRWTQYGIPHVKADNYVDLGYGYGYASARTGVCELADRITTLRGQRSGVFGPGGKALVGFVHTSNLDSDLFYRVMLSDAAVSNAYKELTVDARHLVDGFAAGFNRFVRGIAAVPHTAIVWRNPYT